MSAMAAKGHEDAFAQGWAPAVGSVNRPSRGRRATGETRRFRTFPAW